MEPEVVLRAIVPRTSYRLKTIRLPWPFRRWKLMLWHDLDLMPSNAGRFEAGPSRPRREG